MIQKAERPIILIICDYYLPGYESGGSMRTLVNMIERFGDRFDFRIITRDHDGKLNRTPYTSVKINEWNRVANSEVFYVSKENIRPGLLKRLINEIAPHAIYVNSFFSPLTIFTLMLRKFRRIPNLPFILAPEGEFSIGSLTLKPLKKRHYRRFAKLLNLQHNIIWKVAAESERQEVELFTGESKNIFVAPNMPPKKILEDYEQNIKAEKSAGIARLVFLSRFMRTKNLNWLLEHIRSIKGDLEIDIYGPLEDADYWEEGRRIIASLPENIKVATFGPVPNSEAAQTMAKYHFFVLPTLGENFGHVFIEALAAGCPLIISDRTPWRNLAEKGIGWDLPLESPQSWLDVLEKCIDMPKDEYDRLSSRARQFAVDWLQDPSLDESNMRVLKHALDAASVK